MINWGSRKEDHPAVQSNAIILNPPERIRIASNKLLAFQAMSGSVPIPEFTTDRSVASGWLSEREGKVVCRTVLSGHSGEGIVIASSEAEMVDAPLYTKYRKKTEEYRIHVFRGEVFFVQRKARSREVADDLVNWQVRNRANGFIYANQDVEAGQALKDAAVAAVQALQLDFGAVDILGHRNGDCTVLEVNTAPGLTGTTLQKYTEVFTNFANRN